MPLSDLDKRELYKKTETYLNSLTLVNQKEYKNSSQYYQHLPMKSFFKDGDDVPYYLVSLRKDLESYLEKIQVELKGKVGRSTIVRVVDWGLSSRKAISEIVEKFEDAFNVVSIIFIPLSNIELRTDRTTFIRLANTILVKGDNELFKYLSEQEQSMQFSRNTCFLKFEIQGDFESQRNQIPKITNDALSVLRFFAPMGNSRGKRYNVAKDVRVFTPSSQDRFYIVQNNNQFSLNSLSNIEKIFVLDKKQLNWFYEYGLDHLNNDFITPTKISIQILLALKWYDSGLQAEDDFQALYRFILSINSILIWDEKDLNASNLKKRVEKIFLKEIIEIKDNNEVYKALDFLISTPSYEESLTKDYGTPKKDILEVMSQEIGNPFLDLFTKQRNKVLHGRLPDKKRNIKEDAELARNLAHNLIRVMIKIISKNHEWTALKDVENWLNS